MSKGRGGRPWERIRGAILDRAGYLCEGRCRAEGRHVAAAEVHHRVPLADGGSDAAGNLQALCAECHREAHGRTRQPYEDRRRRRWW